MSPSKAKQSAVSQLNEDIPIEHAFEYVGRAEIVPPKWIIKNVIPTGMSIFVSPPKNYKSTVLLHWLLKIIGKEDSNIIPEHLSQPVRNGPVVMISTETTPGVIKFDAMFGLGVQVLDDDPLLCQSDPFAFRLDNEDNMKEFYYWMRRIKPVAIVFDTLRNSHSQDENDAGAMVNIMQPFQQFCIRNDIAGIIVHHMTKPGDKAKPDDILKPESARGTGALFGLADALIRQVVLPSPNETTEQPEIRLAATIKRGKAIDETFTLNVEWGKLQLEIEVAANIYNFIHKRLSPCTNVEICEAVKLGEAEVLKYVNYLYKKRIINKHKKGWEINNEN